MADKYFGFKQVDEQEHRKGVDSVFSSVASKYDVMNDFMSFGLHRLWKRDMVAEIAPNSRKKYLDVAGGSGDISFRVWEKGAHVTLTDINPDMLQVARDKAVDKGILERIEFAEMNAEKMPYADESFDVAGIAFGIRNVTNIDVALREFFRVLKRGGKFVCLEFSQVDNEFLAKAYDAYSFNVIPKVGGLVAGDEASYKYLVESIRKFPAADVFEKMISDAGFSKTSHRKLTFGTVAIHVGVKL